MDLRVSAYAEAELTTSSPIKEKETASASALRAIHWMLRTHSHINLPDRAPIISFSAPFGSVQEIDIVGIKCVRSIFLGLLRAGTQWCLKATTSCRSLCVPASMPRKRKESWPVVSVLWLPQSYSFYHHFFISSFLRQLKTETRSTFLSPHFLILLRLNWLIMFL